MAPKFFKIAHKKSNMVETPPALVADIMKLFTSMDTDKDGRIASHDMGKHLYAINRMYKLMHGIPASTRGFSDTTEIIAHFDEDEDGELNFQEFLKGMSEVGAYEKVVARSIGRKAGTSRSFDRAIQGVKDSLLENAHLCKVESARSALRGMSRMYDRSTSANRHARCFRDLQDAVRSIPRYMLSFANGKAVLDMLHVEIVRRAAIIVVRAFRSYSHLKRADRVQATCAPSGRGVQWWARGIRAMHSRERRRQKTETVARTQRRRMAGILKNKAAVYLQSLYRGHRARTKYGFVIAKKCEETKAKKRAEELMVRQAQETEEKERAKKERETKRQEETFVRGLEMNPFQKKYLRTFANKERPRLGYFNPITQDRDEVLPEEHSWQSKDIAGLDLTQSSVFPQSLPSGPMITPQYTSKDPRTMMPASIDPAFSRSLFVRAAATSKSKAGACKERRISNIVLDMFKRIGIATPEMLTRSKDLTKPKTGVLRTTVGTSLDPWQDGHTLVAKTNAYDTARKKKVYTTLKNVYGKAVERPRRRKVPRRGPSPRSAQLTQKNTSGGANTTASLAHARQFLVTR
jgi:hypothetical protein